MLISVKGQNIVKYNMETADMIFSAAEYSYFGVNVNIV